MPLLEHPIIAAIIAGLVLTALVPVMAWLFRKVFRPEIHIVSAMEKGPTSRELGFTEPAVRITLTNKRSKSIRIKDIRLMFCGHFGASIAPEAPAGRSHRALPVSLASGKDDHWFIPAEKLSALLRSLHRPPKITGTELGTVTLYARCVTGTNQIYKGPSFPFSTDSNSNWP